MILTRNAWSLQPDGGRDADAEIPATCLCGHDEDMHEETGCWNDGPCEVRGCPCGYFRRYEDTEEDEWPST